MIAGQLALVVAAVAEQPARLMLDDQSLLIEWKPVYKRGFAMQAPLAVAGFLLGLLAWWQTDVWVWLVGALVLVSNWPYTLLGIMPTNNKLMTIDPANAGADGRELVQIWARATCCSHRARLCGSAVVSMGVVAIARSRSVSKGPLRLRGGDTP
jgi:hypothetical protein